jgi:very-short-patch-repair endonuclease
VEVPAGTASAIVKDYTGGMSELAAARAHGYDRATIRRVLLEHSVAPRGRHEASLLRMSRLTPEERSALAAAAHEAVRGRVQPDAERRKRALAGEVGQTNRSEAERIFERWLVERGLRPTPQKAIGRYNADLAVESVAVEILGGGWHGQKARHGARTKYILDAGWHVVFVWVDGFKWPLLPEAADYVAAFAEEARRNPSGVREYRVIRGGGQEVARGRANRYDLTRIPAPHGDGDRSAVAHRAWATRRERLGQHVHDG